MNWILSGLLSLAIVVAVVTPSHAFDAKTYLQQQTLSAK